MSCRIRAVEHRKCAAGLAGVPECFCVNNCGFELVKQFYHVTEFGNVANAVSACVDQPQQTKKDNCFG